MDELPPIAEPVAPTVDALLVLVPPEVNPGASAALSDAEQAERAANAKTEEKPIREAGDELMWVLAIEGITAGSGMWTYRLRSRIKGS